MSATMFKSVGGAGAVFLVGVSLFCGLAPSSQPTSRTKTGQETAQTTAATHQKTKSFQGSQKKVEAGRREQPLLYETARLVLAQIHRQESQKDATCWTTVRMMEHFYARKPLRFYASLVKIEATKLLLYQLWKKASALSPHATLTLADIQRVNPLLLRESSMLLGARAIPVSSNLYQRTKVKDYHKVTENWRQILSIAMESFVAEGLFARGYVDVKPLNQESAEQLANLSTGLTVALLEKAQILAEQHKHEEIEVKDILGAYRVLQQPLGLNTPLKRPFRVKIRRPEAGYALLRQMTLENMQKKIQSLRKWNQRIWQHKNTTRQLLSLVNRLTTLSLTDRDLEKLLRYLQATLRLYALGAPLQESQSQTMSSLGIQHVEKRRFDADKTGQAPKRPKFLSFLWMSNGLSSLFPFVTKVNGDVEFYVAAKGDALPPVSLPAGKSIAASIQHGKRLITGPDLDAIRDTTIHWYALSQLWSKEPKALPMDPFAAELLSERLSELVLYLLREAEAFQKKEQASKNVIMRVPGETSFQRFLQRTHLIFVHPHKHREAEMWGNDQIKHKTSLMRSYRHPLFVEINRRKAGWKLQSCRAAETWIKKHEISSTHPDDFAQPKDKNRVDREYLGLQVWMGAGIAVGDYDNDGKTDVFFAGEGCNRLYRNLGNYKFQDVTEESGITGLFQDSRQALFVDVNNDGLLDLFVVHSTRPSRLFLQLPNHRFVDITERSGITTSIGASAAVFFDYDNDGLLDLYVGHYGAYLLKDRQLPVVDGTNGRPNMLFRNIGGGRFVDVTKQAGVGSKSWTLAVAALDVDRDGYQDLWLANDFGFDELYLNQRNGTFRNISQELDTNDRGSGMNVSFIDVNGDGYWDVYISVIDMFSKSIRFILPQPKSLIPLHEQILQTSFYLSGNKFFVSESKLRYRPKEGIYFEPGQRGWSWSAVFFDYENDGDQDMYLANGWRKNALAADQENQFFLFDQRRFYQHPGPSPILYKGNSRSATAVDLSGTGKQDLVLNDFDTGPKLFRNTSPSQNRWVKIRLHGIRSNRFGVGATVRVEAPPLPPQQKQIGCGINYLAQEDVTLTFGLKHVQTIQRIVVNWPGGQRQILQGPLATQTLHTVHEAP